ncbi:Atxe2 family lasso peptide isopeptidase [Sphingomonas sp. MG17]|uniref:Atxe2 family lasso peptide isopeptidase n=1 Tax=Sphingomonas tagetis TaxID=2949092 RepID=A0A9X2HRC9_9SPHN|nr:Atxe2 family lasso peptide isopeptidase [Sphingomonas tagetis]MCP3732169.1 Atxe2 family lasso peptide isopeptidase [Sphingomonas tagetis]
MISLAAIVLATTSARASCEDVVPADPAGARDSRDIEPIDLARLRDIGPGAVTFLNRSPIGVSPDGKQIAFQARRADPGTNSHCHAVLVIEPDAPAKQIVVDRGGELIRVHFQRGPLSNYPSGEPQLITPIWSPDGRHIGFLKRIAGRTQVWVAAADGSGSRQLTHADADVEAFDWTSDGAILFRTRPQRREALQAIDDEGGSGLVFDERWSPLARNRPSHREPTATLVERIDLIGQVRPADGDEREALGRHEAVPEGAIWTAASPIAVAWIAPDDPSSPWNDGRLRVRRTGRQQITCTAAACAGQFTALWWSRDEREVWFLRRTGWGNSQISLYSWQPGHSSPRHLLTTRDELLGCRPARTRLVCALEQSARPRRIVSVDTKTGEISEIFDPNPEFAGFRLGPVERLQWTNDRGIEIYGDLVLPPTRKPGERVPLIIVQYRTRGFLRGGTGDEYPIFALAAQGFAVLSLERPDYVSSLTPGTNFAERAKLNYGGWADRRSVLSAYATGVALLDRRGLIDPARVGITGLSDGSVSAQFALVNSSLFAAAALSGCCEEPKTLAPLLGLTGSARLRTYLYPAYTEDKPEFWEPYSIATNAKRFRTPLLVQSSDDEYLASLETFTSLREAGAPIDLIVFPDEHHTKWQPAHRLAVYRRNIAWFSFWLKGSSSPDAMPSDLGRWATLRSASRRQPAP